MTKYRQMLEAYREGKLFLPYSPLHLYIEPTNLCNLNCKNCPREQMSRSKGKMELSLYKDITKQCKELGIEWVYLFLVGESLLNRQIDKMVNIAHDYGLKVRMHTNGTVSRIRELRVDALYISLNNTDPSRIIPNLEVLIKEQVPFKILALEGWSLSLPERYSPYIEMKAFHNWRKGDKLGSQVLCSQPYKTFAIGWDGICGACCVDYNLTYIIGDAKTEPLEQIWNSSMMQKLREHPQALCYNCDFKRTPDEEKL